MEKYIFDQSNGLWYELQGDYYIPRLVLDEAETSPIGMWGRKHQQYLKEHRPMLYSDLILSGKLYDYLADIESERPSREAQARELWLQTEHLWTQFPGFVEALKKQ